MRAHDASLITQRPGGTMRTRTAAVAAALLLASLTACSNGNTAVADPAACKEAMAKAFDEAMAAGDKAKEGKRPPACEGVDNKTLEMFAGEVMAEWVDGNKAADELEEDLDEIEQELDDTLNDLDATEAP